jgi:hypothetical protein
LDIQKPLLIHRPVLNLLKHLHKSSHMVFFDRNRENIS